MTVYRTSERLGAGSGARSLPPRTASRRSAWSSSRPASTSASNIRWSRELEEVGAHVVHGIPGLKTHAKVILVVRREQKGTVRHYVMIGTGNFHAKQRPSLRGFRDIHVQPP